MFKSGYIFTTRKSLCILLITIGSLAVLFGYILGYLTGIEKARAEVPIIPNTKIIEKPVLVEQPVVEKVAEPEPLPASNSDINLVALITMAEAEGEPEMGKRLVIDTILNRVDSSRFPNTIHDVIYSPGQFECTWNGRLSRCYVRDDIRELVIEEMRNRTRSDVHYFRAGYYHGFGKRVVNVGNHYFSTY